MSSEKHKIKSVSKQYTKATTTDKTMHKILKWYPQEKRKSKRPKRTWVEDIRRTINEQQLNDDNVQSLTFKTEDMTENMKL